MNVFRSLVVVALVLISGGLMRAEERQAYTLTVAVKYQAAKDGGEAVPEQKYVVPGFVEDSVTLPVWLAEGRVILFCTLVRDQSAQVKMVDVGMAEILPESGKDMTVSVYRGFFPYQPGKAITVLDGRDLVTVQVDEVKKP